MRFSVLSMATLAAANAAVHNRQNDGDGIVSLPVVSSTLPQNTDDGDNIISMPVVSLPPVVSTSGAGASTSWPPTTASNDLTGPVVTITPTSGGVITDPLITTTATPPTSGGSNATASTTVITSTVNGGGGGGGGGGDGDGGSGGGDETDTPGVAPTAFVNMAAGFVAVAGFALAL